jgi:hypothetical protein
MYLVCNFTTASQFSTLCCVNGFGYFTIYFQEVSRGTQKEESGRVQLRKENQEDYN